jgi:hypothetical protein
MAADRWVAGRKINDVGEINWERLQAGFAALQSPTEIADFNNPLHAMADIPRQNNGTDVWVDQQQKLLRSRVQQTIYRSSTTETTSREVKWNFAIFILRLLSSSLLFLSYLSLFSPLYVSATFILRPLSPSLLFLSYLSLFSPLYVKTN